MPVSYWSTKNKLGLRKNLLPSSAHFISHIAYHRINVSPKLTHCSIDQHWRAQMTATSTWPLCHLSAFATPPKILLKMDLSMSTTRASSPAIQIDPKDAEKYGLREVEILASTNEKCLDRFPDPCWALKKTISTVRNFEFEQLYSSKLQEPILATVKQATSAWKQIHVVRLGFQLEEKDPLVTLIIINNSSLSRRSAQALATKIHAIITSQWSGER